MIPKSVINMFNIFEYITSPVKSQVVIFKFFHSAIRIIEAQSKSYLRSVIIDPAVASTSRWTPTAFADSFC